MNARAEVLVCTYNGACFVVEQLQSILKQTTRVAKISIYDDRSSDDTVPRIQEFVSCLPLHDQRLFTVHVNTCNLGYARNFINAIARSTEDILFLCDQDDIWEPEKVERFLSLFREHRPDMVFSDGCLIDDSGRKFTGNTVLDSYGLSEPLISQFRDRAFELLLRRNYINGAAAAIRGDTARNALPLPCDMPHDYWLAIWCSLHAGVVATPQALYRYRQHHGNLIGIGSSNLLYELLGVWRHPTAPRERELHIWKAITDRIATLADRDQAEAARRKVDWLSRVVAGDKKSFARGFQIAKSALNGSYRTYSSRHSFLRDLVSLIK